MPEIVYVSALIGIYTSYQVMRRMVYRFVIVMSRPQPAWLDVKRLHHGGRHGQARTQGR